MTERSISSSERTYLFGPFRLLPARQLLLKGNKDVRIGSRALAVLIALVERAGELVTKNELMEIAWPQTVVEHSNLKVTVASLRRALGEARPGDRYLRNEPGRGYRFIAQVLCADGGSASGRARRPRAQHIPFSSTRMIGRAEAVAALVKTLPERRLVSIVGPGGIGKTTVALAVSEAMASQLEHGVHFVDLASLTDAKFVPMALAKTLGVVIHSECAVEAVVMALRGTRQILVFDSCEHVLPTITVLINQILAICPDVLVLTTTREPLRIPGETLYRLPQLATPCATACSTAARLRSFAAVELFIERACACLESFKLSDEGLQLIAEICRKLEGLPLAIELAATRVDTFTLRELTALLDDKLHMLNVHQSSALARHRSLAAALEWSYALLSESERTALRRLSVFDEPFTLASAHLIAGKDCEVVIAVEGLVAKSLLLADVAGTVVRYRLMDMTRAFAAQKLSESGECSDAIHRRTAYLLDRTSV